MFVVAPRDEIAIAGLDRAHVEQFCALGFDHSKVVSNGSLHIIYDMMTF
jgi:hypothetical protein